MSIPSSYLFARADLHQKNFLSYLKTLEPSDPRLADEAMKYMEYIHKALRRLEEERESITALAQ
jgi:hypothetical protein